MSPEEMDIISEHLKLANGGREPTDREIDAYFTNSGLIDLPGMEVDSNNSMWIMVFALAAMLAFYLFKKKRK